MDRDALDAELLRYLREQKEREIREASGTREALTNIANQVQLLGQKLDANHVLVGERITGLSARVDALEDEVEDTGVHNLERFKAEQAEKDLTEAKLTHAKWVDWAVKGTGALLLLALGTAGKIMFDLFTKGHP